MKEVDRCKWEKWVGSEVCWWYGEKGYGNRKDAAIPSTWEGQGNQQALQRRDSSRDVESEPESVRRKAEKAERTLLQIVNHRNAQVSTNVALQYTRLLSGNTLHCYHVVLCHETRITLTVNRRNIEVLYWLNYNYSFGKQSHPRR